MQPDIDEVVEEWGSPSFPSLVPPERYEEYSGKVPDLLMDYWREFGFSGFNNGLWWICDPTQWQPAVNTWTQDLGLTMGDDIWLAVTRSAFGSMQLWGARTGMSLTIIPYLGWVFPSDRSDRMETPRKRDGQIYSAFLGQTQESLEVIGDDKKLLFGRVLDRLGPVAHDTMYAFVPAPALGGALLPDKIEIVDAATHMQLLNDLTPRKIMGDITQSPIARN